MNPNEYVRLLQSGATAKVSGLCGRILRGKRDEDFRTLTDDASRKVVMLVGPDGLEKLMGKSGYEMLVEIGYEPDYIDQKLSEGTEFRLAVFQENARAFMYFTAYLKELYSGDGFKRAIYDVLA